MDSKHEEKLSTLLFEERLSDRTLVERRNLLFAASFGLVVHAYAIAPKVPWLDTDLPAKAPELLRGGVGLAVAYLVSMFAFYVWDDYRRWRLADKFIDIGGVRDSIETLFTAIVAMQSAIHEHAPSGPDKDKISGFAQLVKLEAAMGDLRGRREVNWAQEVIRNRDSLRNVQRVRLVVLDIGIPLVLGLFAVLKLYNSVVPFLLRVIQ